MSDVVTIHQLREVLEQHFDIKELQELSFTLEIEYENLPGNAKSTKVIELVQYAKRHGRYNDLVRYVQQARPFAKWENIETFKNSTPPAVAPISSPPTTVNNFYGNMMGVATGDGASVNVENLAGRDVNITTQPPQSTAEFAAQLAELKALVEQAVANNEIKDAEEQETAVSDIDNAIKEANKEKPEGTFLKLYIDRLTKIISSATNTGAALIKAAPIVAGLKKAAEMIFG